jgi:hypothetical protein
MNDLPTIIAILFLTGGILGGLSRLWNRLKK